MKFIVFIIVLYAKNDFIRLTSNIKLIKKNDPNTKNIINTNQI